MLCQGWDSESGRQHLCHFAYQFRRWTAWDSTLGFLSALRNRIQRHGGQGRCEHDLYVGSRSEARRASSIAVLSGITISLRAASRMVPRGAADGRQTIVHGIGKKKKKPENRRFSSALTRKRAHVVVVFARRILCMGVWSSNPNWRINQPH